MKESSIYLNQDTDAVRTEMKLGRLNHIGVATPSIEGSVRYYRDVMGATSFQKPFDLEARG